MSRIDPEGLVDAIRATVDKAQRAGGVKAKRAALVAAGVGQRAFHDRIMNSALPHSKNPPGRVKTGAMQAAGQKPRVAEDSAERFSVRVGWAHPEARKEYFRYQEEGTRFVQAMQALPAAAVAVERSLGRETR